MAKKPYTLTLDNQVVTDTREYSDNLSATVTELLREFVARCERENLKKQLNKYEKDAKERRERLGIFNEEERKFC